MLKKSILALKFLFLLIISATAQEAQNIKGTVTDASDGEPMPMVAVGIDEENIWTATDLDGVYELKNVPAGTHVITVKCLGYRTLEKEITVPLEGVVDLEMTPRSLALGEVEVTARRGSGIASSSVIGREAIEHIQASDITEIMQLLPGQVSSNPDLSGVSQLGIREITGSAGDRRPSAMASLGTGLRIDGAPISNEANMQMLSTSVSDGSAFQSTAMQGADMRQFSVDNIESIEVVQGIPGVEEGDALSGVVRINTISGETPLTVRAKADPNVKQVYLGKGLNFSGATGGTLNMDLDFLQNHSDIRTPYRSFNRLSGNVAYNNTFFQGERPLRFSLSARYYDSRNLSSEDPDRLRQEEFSTHDRNLSMNMTGRWALNSLFLTNLNLNVSGSLQRQETREVDFQSFSSIRTNSLSDRSGLHEAAYIHPRYYSDVTIDGRPYYFNASLSGTRSFEVGDTEHTLRAGVDYRLSGNKGDGTIFDRNLPPDPTRTSRVRPRPFYDVPALERVAFYFAEEATVPIGSTTMEVNAGVRFTNAQPDGLFSSGEGLTSLDPRINLRYHIFQNREDLLSDLGIRLGFGRLSMMPTISHLYPDKAYSDINSFNYYDPPQSLAVITTHVVEDTRNYDLKQAINNKFEAGLDVVLGNVDMQFTGYYEHMEDGFDMQRVFYPVQFTRYDRLSQSGLAPEFIPGEGVFFRDPESGEMTNVPSRQDTIMRNHSFPENAMEVKKYGLEFEFDFGRYDPLHTSFLFSGSYMYQHRRDTEDYFNSVQSVEDQVVGIYPAGRDGRINQRLVSNLRTVTHIRPLAMVVSLNLQTIWIEKTQFTHEDADGNPIVYTHEPTDDVYGDVTQRKYYNPVAVMDLSGNVIPWEPEFANIRPYADLIRHHSNNYRFVPRSYDPVFQLNMRLTKEISESATIAFNVNNITNYRPLQKIRGWVDNYTRRNQGIYFSGEVTIRI